MKNRYRKNGIRAFTLIEMVVSMGVLSILCVMMTQIITSCVTVSLALSKHIDADTEARFVLDRISYDVARMVQRSDVDYSFSKSAGSDEMYFFSESGGYYPSGVSPSIPSSIPTSSGLDPRGTAALVGYRINPATNKLERLSKGLVWGGVSGATSMIYLPQTIGGTWPSLSTDTTFQTISSAVFRMQIQFLVQNSSTAAAISNYPNLENNISPGTSGYFNPKEVTAVVVSIAVLDPSSQNLVTATSLSTAASQLSSATGPMLPVAGWTTTVPNLSLPKDAIANIRCYQRFCYLPHEPLFQ